VETLCVDTKIVLAQFWDGWVPGRSWFGQGRPYCPGRSRFCLGRGASARARDGLGELSLSGSAAV
jgi:hypothetical protein